MNLVKLITAADVVIQTGYSLLRNKFRVFSIIGKNRENKMESFKLY